MKKTITTPLYKIVTECHIHICLDIDNWHCNECPLHYSKKVDNKSIIGFILEDTGTDVIINDKSQVITTYTKL